MKLSEELKLYKMPTSTPSYEVLAKWWIKAVALEEENARLKALTKRAYNAAKKTSATFGTNQKLLDILRPENEKEDK